MHIYVYMYMGICMYICHICYIDSRNLKKYEAFHLSIGCWRLGISITALQIQTVNIFIGGEIKSRLLAVCARGVKQWGQSLEGTWQGKDFNIDARK